MTPEASDPSAERITGLFMALCATLDTYTATHGLTHWEAMQGCIETCGLAIARTGFNTEATSEQHRLLLAQCAQWLQQAIDRADEHYRQGRS